MAIERYTNTPTPASPSTPWTTLNGALAAGASSFTATDGSVLPVAPFRILIESEWILVGARSGNTCSSLTRGIESSTDADHASGTGIFHVLTASGLANHPRSMTTAGDLEYLDVNGAPARLPAPALDGTYALTWAGGIPTAWSAVSSGNLSGTFTAGRMPYTTGAHALADSAYLTFAPTTVGSTTTLLRAGPPDADLDPAIQDYTGGVYKWTAAGGQTNTNVGFGLESQADSTFGHVGLYAVALQLNTSAGGVAAFEGDAYLKDAGAGQYIHAFEGYAEVLAGTADKIATFANIGLQGSALVKIAFDAYGGFAGTSATYGFRSLLDAGPGVWAFYGGGTAPSHFGGAIDVPSGGLTVGTGVVTLAGNFTTTGSFNPTFAIPSSSTWTFPSGGGTLANLDSVQAFTNKTGAVSMWTNDASYTTLAAVAGVGYLTSVTAHNLLSTTHGDTLADSVVRGDLLYGNSTPKWARLAKPSVLSGLSHDGTDVSWVTATGTGAPVRAASPTFTGNILMNGAAISNDFTGGSGRLGIGDSGNQYALFINKAGNTVSLGTDIKFGWDTASSAGASGTDLALARDAANALAQRNGAAAQVFRPYGYFASTSSRAYGAVQTALASVTLSGATTATGNIVPVGCFVIGVATTTTTTITGASGYQIGDGADADRYGDITGTAVGTDSDNTDATANPTGYNAAASAITLTAKTSNFTGGVVQVVVFYVTTGAD